ncbi:MAG TPA: DMT family transporter, partial [Roseiflexaceae bacterium]|nr:DMT family transporter [Roseiflexaceae bacterium]
MNQQGAGPARGSNTGYALSIAAPLIWATTGVLIKYLLEMGAPRLPIAFWRDAAIAVVCLGGLLALRPSALRVGRRELRGFALTGVISVGLYHALWVTSIDLNGAAVATVLIYTFPAFVTLGAWLFFHEPIRRPQIAALALALIGCALVVRAYDPAVLQVSWLGVLVGLSTGITHAGYVLFSQRAVQSHSPWVSLAYTMLFGTLALLAMNLLAAPRELFAIGDTALPWLVLLALALGPTLGGYALFTAALRYVPGRIASLIAVVEAPASALLAVLFLGEHMEWRQLLGLALILGAIGLPRLV